MRAPANDGRCVGGSERMRQIYADSHIDAHRPKKTTSRSSSRHIDVLYRSRGEEDSIIEDAKKMSVGFVTAGDTMLATTHVDLRIQAKEAGIPVRIFHGVSIFTACPSSLGLQPYKFGRTVTLPFYEMNYRPKSPYDNILENKVRGLHTMVLLDIRESEGRYMTAREAIEWLLEGKRSGAKASSTTGPFCAWHPRWGPPTRRSPPDIPETS